MDLRIHKRRKIDEAELRAKRSCVPELPSELWKSILDFTPFENSMKMACVSKFFLLQVLPLLQHIHVTNTASLARVYAARCPNVQEITVGCLLHILPSSVSSLDTTTYYAIHPSTGAHRVLVPFLSFFPSLKYVFLAASRATETRKEILNRLGLEVSNTTDNNNVDYQPTAQYTPYRRRQPIYPQNKETESSLTDALTALAGAYQAGSIAETVTVHGLPCYHTRRESCRGRSCDLCTLICKTFPLRQVAIVSRTAPPYFPCVTEKSCLVSRLIAVGERPGGQAYLTASAARLFQQCLNQYELQRIVVSRDQLFTYEYSWTRWGISEVSTELPPVLFRDRR